MSSITVKAKKIEAPSHLDIKELALTREMLEKSESDPTQYVEVAFGEEIIGFVTMNELKQYLEENEDKYADTFVKKWGMETWVPATQQAFLQRRKPTLVKNSEISPDERFYFLKEGQKMGPYTINDLKAKIDRKEILVTEMIVPEKGGEWFKLFELSNFDRRLPPQTPEDLPNCPDATVFEHSSDKKKSRFEEREAMAGLAFIGQIKTGKVQEPQEVVSEEGVFEEDTALKMIKQQNTLKRLFISAIATIISLALTWFYIFHWDDAAKAFRTPASTEIKNDAPVLTPLKVTSPLEQRNEWKKKNSNNALRPFTRSRTNTPQSIRDSNTFRNQQEQFLNYDQGQNPIESDPVRDRLSVETLTPQPIEEATAPVQPQESWVNPENVQPANPSESPFDGETTN